MPPQHALSLSEMHGYNFPYAKGRTEEKACLETNTTTGSAIIARLNINVGWPQTRPRGASYTQHHGRPLPS